MANKLGRLAEAYAKMADDDSLRALADRIQARAVRRMGELYKTFNARGQRTDQLIEGTLNKLSQKEVRESAGISQHQAAQAVRVANVPCEKFEAAIEQPTPATVTQLAEDGQADPECTRSFRAPAGWWNKFVGHRVAEDGRNHSHRDLGRRLPLDGRCGSSSGNFQHPGPQR